MKTPLLQTERLILRPISLDDAPAIQKYFNDWGIIQHLSTKVPWPYPAEGAVQFISSVLDATESKRFIWVIVEKSGTGEAIGAIDFRTVASEEGNRGFWLAKKYQGRGYMTEAVQAVNNFVFNTLGIESYIVCNHAENEGSRRVKKKTGARFLGTFTLEHHNGINQAERWEVRVKPP